jgi:hypothetical protein
LEPKFVPTLSAAGALVPERVRHLMQKLIAAGASEGGVEMWLSATDIERMGITDAELAEAQRFRLRRLNDSASELPMPDRATPFFERFARVEESGDIVCALGWHLVP